MSANPGWRMTLWCLLPVAASGSLRAQQPAGSSRAPGIQDNSFLLEEAYNQEPGVVQHISALARSSSGDWVYTFTQEWPLSGLTHQVSFTLPIERISAGSGGRTGVGDVALNYRYQLAGSGAARVALSPRLSLLLPTGREEAGRGSGGFGVQGNLPLSTVLSDRLVAHWNAGGTVVPSARNPGGQNATIADLNLGASLVWLADRSFNLLIEGIWLSEESVVGTGSTDRSESLFINPGVRGAINFPSGLQIVPGVAYTIGVGPSNGDDSLFLYLSFEHAFKTVSR